MKYKTFEQFEASNPSVWDCAEAQRYLDIPASYFLGKNPVGRDCILYFENGDKLTFKQFEKNASNSIVWGYIVGDE